MLLEIHILQNHSPSNLNRDDTGSPKECVFGGVRRARISSQCLKRSIRRSDLFQVALDGNLSDPFQGKLAGRTRQLPEFVRERLLASGLSEEIANFAAEKASGVAKSKETPEKPNKRTGKLSTAQSLFLTSQDVNAVCNTLLELAKGKTLEQFKGAFAAKKKGKKAEDESEEESGEKLQSMIRRNDPNGFRPISVDVALFGRMATSEAFRDVDAACQVAHALSTHRVEQEFDYFTAVDDFQGRDESEGEEDSGADMIGDVEFNSACYYKYFSIDVDALVDNLVGRSILKDKVIAEDEQNARELACKAILALIESAVRVTPTGKQNTFASHTLPDAVLIEVRSTRSPVSYANAFANPVRPSASEGKLVSGSIAQLHKHAEKITEAYSLNATDRFWFAPDYEKDIQGTQRVTKLSGLLDEIQKVVCE
jgi:CRISPR system Cascade subunit CasC